VRERVKLFLDEILLSALLFFSRSGAEDSRKFEKYSQAGRV
jgi:hypothetical protein